MALDIDDLENDGTYFLPSKYRTPMRYMLGNILYILNGYSDYVVSLPLESQRMSLHEAIKRNWCLEYLAENKIINYVERENGETITVLNRYNLELLSLLLEGNQKDVEKLPNLIYYQPTTGKGFVNGHPINLKKLNKRLFDALFIAAPEPVLRKQLTKVVKASKSRDNASAYAINEAFSNLRKACKVNAKVIKLHDYGRLDAQVFTLDSSFFSDDFSID